MIESGTTIAFYVVTTHGYELARRLAAEIFGVRVFVSTRVAKLVEHAVADGVELFEPPLAPLVARTFNNYSCHVFFLAVGASVRIVAPHLIDKKIDPAVIAIDDAARFAVSLCSGHVGRGNEWTLKLATRLGATPVVTTASDVLSTLPVDILGRELGWTLDDPVRNVTRASGAVVNGEAVALVHECGEPSFWAMDRSLPPNIRYFSRLGEVEPDRFSIILIISDREIEQAYPRHWAKAVIYRPPSLVVGIGCDRETPSSMLARGVATIFGEHGLALRSVGALVSIDLKSNEEAILSLAAAHRWPLRFFDAAALDAVAHVPTPSETVLRHVGTRGVAEPGALLESGASALLVRKTKYTEVGVGRSMTLAIARRPYQTRTAEQS